MLFDPRAAAERRLTLRLLAYWEKKRAGRAMPAKHDIDAVELQDLWGHCFLVVLEDGYRYGHLGEAIHRAYSNGLTGSDPSVLVSPASTGLAPICDRLVELGKPLVEDGEFKNQHDEIIHYRQCLLPLGENGRIHAIFGGMRYRIFPPKA